MSETRLEPVDLHYRDYELEDVRGRRYDLPNDEYLKIEHFTEEGGHDSWGINWTCRKELKDLVFTIDWIFKPDLDNEVWTREGDIFTAEDGDTRELMRTTSNPVRAVFAIEGGLAIWHINEPRDNVFGVRLRTFDEDTLGKVINSTASPQVLTRQAEFISALRLATTQL